jgi:hypothetical protein
MLAHEADALATLGLAAKLFIHLAHRARSLRNGADVLFFQAIADTEIHKSFGQHMRTIFILSKTAERCNSFSLKMMKSKFVRSRCYKTFSFPTSEAQPSADRESSAKQRMPHARLAPSGFQLSLE